MNRVFLISFFLLLTGGICAQQATTGTLTLKEAEQRFLERNLSLIAERYNIDMAQAQVLQAKLFENPVISLEQNVYNRLNGKYFDFGKEGEMVVGIEQVIRLAGRSDHSFVKALIKPGLALQYMTTREPEDDQIEVAIRALEEVRPPESDAYEEE